MNWSDLKSVIGTAAPILGGLVGGPAGAVVGKLVATGLGLSPDSTPDQVAGLLQTNPDAFVKLQQIEADNKVQLQQLMVTAKSQELAAQIAQYSAEAADRDSARKLAAQQPTDWTRQILTYLMTGIFAVIIWFMFTGKADVVKDPIATGTVGILIGLVASELKTMYAYWFGATREGQNQTRDITAFATQPGTVTAADPTTTTISTPAAVNVEPTPASDPIYKGGS